MSIKNLSEPVRLEQLAEECSELAQAALKLARIRRGENPTPVVESAAADALLEEIADVLVCMDAVIRPVDFRDVERYCTEKKQRWEARLKAAHAILINGKEVQPG